jgi:hypothetical protein
MYMVGRDVRTAEATGDHGDDSEIGASALLPSPRRASLSSQHPRPPLASTAPRLSCDCVGSLTHIDTLLSFPPFVIERASHLSPASTWQVVPQGQATGLQARLKEACRCPTYMDKGPRGLTKHPSAGTRPTRTHPPAAAQAALSTSPRITTTAIVRGLIRLT